MDKELKYRSTIKSKPFFYKEMKKVASLKLQGFKDFEIKDKVNKDNIFQVNTEARKGEIASTVLNRLKMLDEFLLDQLSNGSMDASKQVAVYSVMKTDRLFFEFMYEVYRDKLLLREYTMEDKDFNMFFDRKKEQSAIVAAWDDYTFYKLKQVYIRILFEAGLIKSQKNEREIAKPLIEEQLANHLKEIGDAKYLNVFVGES